MTGVVVVVVEGMRGSMSVMAGCVAIEFALGSLCRDAARLLGGRGQL